MSTRTVSDGALNAAKQLDYRYELFMPELGFHANYEHIETFEIGVDSYVASGTTLIKKNFRNPQSGATQECALVNERVVSTDKERLYFERVYAPAFSALTAYGSENFQLADWSGLKSGGTLIKAYNFSATADGITATQGTATANQDGITDGTISKDNTLVFFADWEYTTHYSSIVGLTPNLLYRVQGFAYVPAGQTAVDGLQIRSRDISGSSDVITVIANAGDGWESFDLLLYSNFWGGFDFELLAGVFETFEGADLITDDRVYLVGLTVTTHQYYGVSFDASKQHIYSERVAISAVGEPEDQEVETSVSEAASPQGTLHYFSAIATDGDFTTDLTQTAADIQDDIPTWYNATRVVTKEGSKVTLYGSRTTSPAANLSANRESIYISGLPAGIGYTISPVVYSGPEASMITIEFFKTQATVQGTLHYATTINASGDFTVDLSLDADDIQAAIPAWYDARTVTKEGSKVTLVGTRSETPGPAANLSANRESIYISGLPTGIGYTISPVVYSGPEAAMITIEFFDSNPSKTTLSTATAVRKLTAAGHDITAGADVAIWNGDTLLGATYAVSVSGDDVYVPIGFLGGKNNTATHIGKNATRTTYGTGNKVAVTKSTIEFYIPGFTSGITTADDIPAIQGGETAQALLDAAVSAAATIKVAGSRLTQIRQRMFAREAATMKAGAILI